MFEWDEAKNRANIAKHGVSFDVARRIFDGPVLNWLDGRRAYGEIRHVGIGRVDGVVFLAVVHTARNGNTRIISARPAKRKERERYDQEKPDHKAIRPGTDA